MPCWRPVSGSQAVKPAYAQGYGGSAEAIHEFASSEGGQSSPPYRQGMLSRSS
jgi:hypothetical protein